MTTRMFAQEEFSKQVGFVDLARISSLRHHRIMTNTAEGIFQSLYLFHRKPLLSHCHDALWVISFAKPVKILLLIHLVEPSHIW